MSYLGQSDSQNSRSTMGRFTAWGDVQNVFVDPALRLKVMYPTTQTPYKSNLNCSNGLANVNNECVCPGMPSAAPYRITVPCLTDKYMNSMFRPTEPGLFPRESRVASALMVDRAPWLFGSDSAGYVSMDSMPMNHCCNKGDNF